MAQMCINSHPSHSHRTTAFEFEPITGDYKVYYYDATLEDDPGRDSDDMEYSLWSYLESVIVSGTEAA